MSVMSWAKLAPSAVALLEFHHSEILPQEVHELILQEWSVRRNWMEFEMEHGERQGPRCRQSNPSPNLQHEELEWKV